ncbi:hypothetical protein [Candidatus Symbiopectobacterium sp. NZEC151]|uniref:hypothetical protein n=1 Tax=Candidatus Symbiopectobacterium sp. NZEC151 TaxID=2820470 RepID=UPI0022272D80|nr:hypothetical protein [Candidatus Symbiopectobacterium sp. NZEC151]MCW2475541.1 hypothetical protein [Candidatus Symbiopectobacterium sp. NZEC151]
MSREQGMPDSAFDGDLAQQLAQDKTDFRKRLALVAHLRVEPDPRSLVILHDMMQRDFVFDVRWAAWEALTAKGESPTEPRKKAGHLMSRIWWQGLGDKLTNWWLLWPF